MVSTKYLKSFLKEEDNLKEVEFILNEMISFEKKVGKDSYTWNKSDVSVFLKGFKALSPLSLNKYATISRKFTDYICVKENIKADVINTRDIDMDQLIDIKGLLEVILSYPQYMNIKNQLSKLDGAEELNVRDKLMFELGWSGLTNEEIKLLRQDKDINFTKDDNDKEIAILSLNTGRTVRIEDTEIVEDIKKCMKEKQYYVVTKNNVYKKMSYRDSNYLIKPVNVGKNKSEDFISNPGYTLHMVFLKNEITCEGINIFNLTLEDIRRSKMVYLLAPENRIFFNDETIAGFFNLKSRQSLNWLKNISSLKYGKA